jgi:drug/metabolite transporter (DMT)-like permease
VLHIFYFVLLGRGYARADLSLVYPIARGLGPMLVPVLAVALLDERVSPPAVVGIGAIVVGIYLISWWGRFRQLFRQPLALLKDAGVRYAVLTGLTIAAYALVDKRGVAHVQPFLYMYLLTLGCALGLAPYILGTQGRAVVVQVWRSSAWPIVAAGLLTFLAYGLVLTALSISRVSYVAPAREVGIVVGVLLGVFVLKEPFGAGRLLGSGFILLGLVFIALAP